MLPTDPEVELPSPNVDRAIPSGLSDRVFTVGSVWRLKVATKESVSPSDPLAVRTNLRFYPLRWVAGSRIAGQTRLYYLLAGRKLNN